MSLEYTPWPTATAQYYRKQGYWLDQPLSKILEDRYQSDSVALICGERKFTYTELNNLSSNLAWRLHQRGFGAGDTALVQLPNVAEFYIVFFALLKLGVAPVNALFSHQRLELTAYTRQLQPRLLIGSSEHVLFFDGRFTQELSVETPLDSILVLGATDYAENLLELIFDPVEGDATRLPRINAENVAFFQLSGGSTGTPKLIPRTHNDYDYSVRQSADICRLSPTSRYLCALPAAHNFPLSSPGALGVFHSGGTVVMASLPEPLACFELIQKHRVTMTALVPSAVILWLNTAAGHRQKLSSLQLLQVGGANFAEAVARRVPQELGCKLQQVFGMAEGLVNYTRLEDDESSIFTSQGRPMCADDEIKIVDTKDQPVADGEVGQLITRGPYTFRGYYNAPEHNARVFDGDGFYYSGDLVQRDGAGNLRVVGRVKDQINRGGEKIATEEIENLLLSHPSVINAALVSVPDPILGEKSCACLVAGVEKLRPMVFRKFLRTKGVAEYKLPDHFQQFEDLPLTAVGKIDKKRLREHAARQFKFDSGTSQS